MRYFDLHCDTISDCCHRGASLYDGELQVSICRGKKYAPWFQCFALWIPDEKRGKAALDYYDTLYQCFRTEIGKYPNDILPCRTAEDLGEAERQGKAGAILTVEGGAALAGKPERLEYLAQCGVKAITLTWNDSCEFGDGAGVRSPKGLTDFGRRAIREMERLQIAVDVSHASDPLLDDVIAWAKKPLLATHSNARSICSHPRNLTDAQFLAIRDSGGVVGLTFVPEFLSADTAPRAEDILRHAEHFLSLGGERCLAIGSDFDGTGLPDGITGIESVETVAELMLRHNYSENLVDSILFGNAYHFFLSLF